MRTTMLPYNRFCNISSLPCLLQGQFRRCQPKRGEIEARKAARLYWSRQHQFWCYNQMGMTSPALEGWRMIRSRENLHANMTAMRGRSSARSTPCKLSMLALQ